MMKLRSIVLIGFAFLLAGAGVFAGGQAEADAEDHLRILWWGGQTRHDRTNQVIDMFSEQHGVTVDPEFTGWGGYWDRLSVLAAAGDLPDVYQMVIERLPAFHRDGLLRNLDEVDTIDKSVLSPGMQEAGTIDGEFVGVVLGQNAYALAYNPELFDEAGVSYPDETWTWDDFVSAAVTIRDELGIVPVENFATQNVFHYWVRSHGGDLYNDDLTGPGWDDDQIIVDFFELALDLQDENLQPGPDYVTQDIHEENTNYAQGEAAMMFIWSNLIESVRRTLGTDSGLTVLPGENSQQGMFLRPSMFFAIAADSSNPELAGQFIQWFLTDFDANDVLAADRGVPPVDEVRSHLARDLDSQQQIEYDYISFVGGHSSAPLSVFPQQEGEILDLLEETIDLVLFRQLTPDQAADQIRDNFESLMTGE